MPRRIPTTVDVSLSASRATFDLRSGSGPSEHPTSQMKNFEVVQESGQKPEYSLAIKGPAPYLSEGRESDCYRRRRRTIIDYSDVDFGRDRIIEG